MPQILIKLVTLYDLLFLSSVHGPHTPAQTPIYVFPFTLKIHLTWPTYFKVNFGQQNPLVGHQRELLRGQSWQKHLPVTASV